MFDQLTALGYGIVVFAVIIVIGTLILVNFGGSVGCQGSNYTAGTGGWVFNVSANQCQNSTGDLSAPLGTAYTGINYMTTQLGTAGLSSWTPAIIAISVGLLFLGAFLVGKGGKKGRY